MQKDILGKKELEALKLNWEFAGPGFMEGRCYATGTCDNRPVPVVREQHLKTHKLLFSEDSKNAEEIKRQHGYLRF